MSYPRAFAPAGFVVILRSDIKALWPAVAAISPCIPRGRVLNCLRQDELYRLWLPSPRTFYRDAAIMLRLRDRGSVLVGERLWADPPSGYRHSCILTAQLELATHFGRSHTILANLIAARYEFLARFLQRMIDELLAAALVSIGRWNFDKKTVRHAFHAAFDDGRIRTLLTEFDGEVDRTQAPDSSTKKQHALRSSYLADYIARRLWIYADDRCH
jgi:hypothetical protein